MPDEGTPEGQPDKPDTKTFTQDEVSGIVKRNIERELAKIGDVEDLKKKAARLDELEAANKSEIEKLTEAAAKEKERADKAEANFRSLSVRFAVTASAGKLGFIDPEDAYRFLDAEDIDYDDNGEPKNIDKLLGSLAKAKPHLVRGSTNGSGDGGPRGNDAPSGTDINAGIRAAFGRP